MKRISLKVHQLNWKSFFWLFYFFYFHSRLISKVFFSVRFHCVLHCFFRNILPMIRSILTLNFFKTLSERYEYFFLQWITREKREVFFVLLAITTEYLVNENLKMCEYLLFFLFLWQNKKQISLICKQIKLILTHIFLHSVCVDYYLFYVGMRNKIEYKITLWEIRRCWYFSQNCR